jgi:hypothetical protein
VRIVIASFEILVRGEHWHRSVALLRVLGVLRRCWHRDLYLAPWESQHAPLSRRCREGLSG